MTMRGSAVVGALLSLAVEAGGVAGQSRSVGDDLKDAGRDIMHIWSSPFHATAEDLEGLGVVGGLFGAGLLLDAPVQRWMASHPESLPMQVLGPFREDSPLSLLGRTFVIVPASLALWLAGHAFDSDDLRDAGIGCATTDISNTLARTTIARLIGRERPRYTSDVYNFEALGGKTWEMRSFPGGHAANIMSCASFFNHRFDLGIGEPLIYTLAALVGTARVADGAHWTSDTLMGMSFGFAVGKAMAGRLREREDEREAAALQPYVMWSIRF
jgi:membrane-associated phospholipid phosphatase